MDLGRRHPRVFICSGRVLSHRRLRATCAAVRLLSRGRCPTRRASPGAVFLNRGLARVCSHVSEAALTSLSFFLNRGDCQMRRPGSGTFHGVRLYRFVHLVITGQHCDISLRHRANRHALMIARATPPAEPVFAAMTRPLPATLGSNRLGAAAGLTVIWSLSRTPAPRLVGVVSASFADRQPMGRTRRPR